MPPAPIAPKGHLMSESNAMPPLHGGAMYKDFLRGGMDAKEGRRPRHSTVDADLGDLDDDGILDPRTRAYNPTYSHGKSEVVGDRQDRLDQELLSTLPKVLAHAREEAEKQKEAIANYKSRGMEHAHPVVKMIRKTEEELEQVKKRISGKGRAGRGFAGGRYGGENLPTTDMGMNRFIGINRPAVINPITDMGRQRRGRVVFPAVEVNRTNPGMERYMEQFGNQRPVMLRPALAKSLVDDLQEAGLAGSGSHKAQYVRWMLGKVRGDRSTPHYRQPLPKDPKRKPEYAGWSPDDYDGKYPPFNPALVKNKSKFIEALPKRTVIKLKKKEAPAEPAPKFPKGKKLSLKELDEVIIHLYQTEKLTTRAIVKRLKDDYDLTTSQPTVTRRVKAFNDGKIDATGKKL